MSEIVHLYAHGEKANFERGTMRSILASREAWNEGLAPFPAKVRHTAANLAGHDWDILRVGDRILVCCAWCRGEWYNQDGTGTLVTDEEMDLLYPRVPDANMRTPGATYSSCGKTYRRKQIALPGETEATEGKHERNENG